ncbi:DUF2530 domain-containing protein [Nocardioides sp.]|jgi:hypothetical protein|uniref:DUF2530 domain-containing protein n=1 Tax=Nocardioides sp. TaxID=35761 RepID=UPI0026207730|nr:DUF2530 domain-containing protein [Nocardioides sp.]
MRGRPLDGVRFFGVGSVVAAVLFIGMLPFAGRLADAGRQWWLWASLAGVGIGLIGWECCRRFASGEKSIENL